MAAKYLCIIAACLVLNVSGLETVNGRIKITIQTTSGCGDTVRFIRDDLGPTYDLYKDYLDIEFVPWGRATRDDNGSLTCQFGARDCWANRLHRCALNLLKDNQDAQVHYMVCEFTTPFPSYNLGSYLCAHAVGLSLVDVDYCVSNPGDELDFLDEEKGIVMTEYIDFIPSVVFNGQMDRELHNEAIEKLTPMICLALANDPSTEVLDCQI